MDIQQALHLFEKIVILATLIFQERDPALFVEWTRRGEQFADPLPKQWVHLLPPRYLMM